MRRRGANIPEMPSGASSAHASNDQSRRQRAVAPPKAATGADLRDELDQAFEAYDLLCPTTKSSRALESNMRAAEAVFRRDVSPFQSCGAIQPQYCTAVADGVRH